MAAAMLGLGIGALGAAVFVPRYLSEDVPKTLRRYTIDADENKDIPDPNYGTDPVPMNIRQYIPYAPKWTTWPDYQRVFWMNHALRTLWPYYNKAIGKMVMEMVTLMIEEQIKPYAFVQAVDVETLDMGTLPMSVGGVKVYQTSEDEGIFECPLTWGSNARVRVGARLVLGPLVLYLPVEIQNLQLQSLARITLRPLTDVLPCLGAVTITLMEQPYLDFSLHVLDSFDLMQLPGVKQGVAFAMERVVGDMLRYPNQMSFDLMENGGALPPPQGMLVIRVVGIKKLHGVGHWWDKVDPYVIVSIKENRKQRTKTLSNNNHPVWNETITTIINDPDTQSITFKLMDDDIGSFDTEIGIAEMPLANKTFFENPGQHETHKVHFLHPEAAGQLVQYAKVGAAAEQKKKAEKEQQASGKPPGETALRRQTQEERRSTRDGDQAASQPASRTPSGDGSKQGNQSQGEAGVNRQGNVDTSEAAKENKEAIIGELELSVKYVPFESSSAASFKKDNAQGKVPDRTKPTPAEKRTEAANRDKQPDSPTNPESRGIVTVTLTQAKSLEAHGKVDPWVEFTMQDPTREEEPDQRQLSTCIANEPNPRWGDKFDFIDVSPTSTLLVQVWDKKGSLESLMSMKALKGKREKQEGIGSVKINIKDVVRNRRLKDSWALQGVQKGDIWLTLDWEPVSLERGWNS